MDLQGADLNVRRAEVYVDHPLAATLTKNLGWRLMPEAARVTPNVRVISIGECGGAAVLVGLPEKQHRLDRLAGS